MKLCKTQRLCLCSTVRSKCSELEVSLHLFVLSCLFCVCHANCTRLLEFDVKPELSGIIDVVNGLVAEAAFKSFFSNCVNVYLLRKPWAQKCGVELPKGGNLEAQTTSDSTSYTVVKTGQLIQEAQTGSAYTDQLSCGSLGQNRLRKPR